MMNNELIQHTKQNLVCFSPGVSEFCDQVDVCSNMMESRSEFMLCDISSGLVKQTSMVRLGRHGVFDKSWADQTFSEGRQKTCMKLLFIVDYNNKCAKWISNILYKSTKYSR